MEITVTKLAEQDVTQVAGCAFCSWKIRVEADHPYGRCSTWVLSTDQLWIRQVKHTGSNGGRIDAEQI